MWYTLKLLKIAPAWGVLNRCGVHFCFRSVSPFTTWCQKWDSNWQLIKLQLTCEDHAFLWFYIGSSKEIIFFLNTQLKLAQKREPLFWQYTVCKWFKCNNKISLFDLIMCSQSGKGEVGMFVLSIHCMKKSPTSKNMILRKGKKKSMKGEFKWDFERLKWDFCWIAKLLYLSF